MAERMCGNYCKGFQKGGPLGYLDALKYVLSSKYQISGLLLTATLKIMMIQSFLNIYIQPLPMF